MFVNLTKAATSLSSAGHLPRHVPDAALNGTTRGSGKWKSTLMRENWSHALIVHLYAQRACLGKDATELNHEAYAMH